MTPVLAGDQSGLGTEALCEIDEAIAAIGRGEMVVVVDDETRENEGDLIVAAEHATPEVINFMITYGRGLVCLTLTPERAEQLELPHMVARNEDQMGTAFTVSVDGAPCHGVTTGISAHDRATTIRLALEGAVHDLLRPGHIFPLIARAGGVLVRPGHTEASVDLARLAGCASAGVIVEIIGNDGHMLRLNKLFRFAHQHGLLITSIERLQEYLRCRTGRVQTVEAFDSISSANISEGVFQLCILRGRPLISLATIAR